MVPRALASREPYVDVTAAMNERPRERSVVLRVVRTTPADAPAPTASVDDPFADVAV